MSPTGAKGTDWAALIGWYLNAGEMLADLDVGCRIVQTFPNSGAAANLAAAKILSTKTVGADLWLLSHPCPEDWNGQYIFGVIQDLTTIGELIVSAGGDWVAADDGTLNVKIDGACEKVDRLASIFNGLMATREL
jgi:hypothetical protein